jgi:very-short-patch-repair endonuclease
MDDERIKARASAKQLRNQMTKAEVALWSRLRRGAVHGRRFRRQHPIGPYVADFACLPVRLIVEVDGDTHISKDERQYDESRDAYLRNHGWRVLRFWNGDVFENLDGVMERISSEVSPRIR